MTGFSLAEEMQAFEFMALSTLSSSLLHNTHRITCSNYTDDIMPHIFVSLKEVENKSMKIPFFSRLNIAGKNATSGSQTSVYMQTDLPCFGRVWVQAGFSLAENTEAGSAENSQYSCWAVEVLGAPLGLQLWRQAPVPGRQVGIRCWWCPRGHSSSNSSQR